jgi:hypothetical protein
VGVEFHAAPGNGAEPLASLHADPAAPGEAGRAAPAPGGEPRRGEQSPGSLVVEAARIISPPAAIGPASDQEAASQTELPWLSAEALREIDDPAERLTLSFLNNLMGEDRNRVQRRLGAPILFNLWRNTTTVHGLETHLDHRDREDQTLLLARERSSLLTRPLRKAVRTGTFLDTFQDLIDNFKAENVPLTDEYEDNHRKRSHFGRLSMRVRTNNSDDPVEVTWRRDGWRLGSGLERVKLGYRTSLTDQLHFSLNSVYFYASSLMDVWGDLHYVVDTNTELHFLFGDKMDIVTGSTMYPVVHSPIALRSVDESPGVMFYVEHNF